MKTVNKSSISEFVISFPFCTSLPCILNSIIDLQPLQVLEFGCTSDLKGCLYPRPCGPDYISSTLSTGTADTMMSQYLHLPYIYPTAESESDPLQPMGSMQGCHVPVNLYTLTPGFKYEVCNAHQQQLKGIHSSIRTGWHLNLSSMTDYGMLVCIVSTPSYSINRGHCRSDNVIQYIILYIRLHKRWVIKLYNDISIMSSYCAILPAHSDTFFSCEYSFTNNLCHGQWNSWSVCTMKKKVPTLGELTVATWRKVPDGWREV